MSSCRAICRCFVIFHFFSSPSSVSRQADDAVFVSPVPELNRSLLPFPSPILGPTMVLTLTFALPDDGRVLPACLSSCLRHGLGVVTFGARNNQNNRSVVSHVLYGSVKITSYDRVAEEAAGSGGGSSRSRTGSWFGGGFGGGFRGSAAAAAEQQQNQLSSLCSSAWYNAPHTSRLMPTMANFHELEAGRDGETKGPAGPCAVH